MESQKHQITLTADDENLFNPTNCIINVIGESNAVFFIHPKLNILQLFTCLGVE